MGLENEKIFLDFLILFLFSQNRTLNCIIVTRKVDANHHKQSTLFVFNFPNCLGVDSGNKFNNHICEQDLLPDFSQHIMSVAWAFLSL